MKGLSIRNVPVLTFLTFNLTEFPHQYNDGATCCVLMTQNIFSKLNKLFNHTYTHTLHEFQPVGDVYFVTWAVDLQRS